MFFKRFYSTSEQILVQKLQKLQPSALKVTDISGGCGSMFSIEITSQSFKGQSLVQQHRMVQDLIKDDIKDMHGLQIKTFTL
jgi:stress-induced morphogen